MRVALCGFGHGHIGSIASHMRQHPELELVGAADEDPEGNAKVIEAAKVELTHPSLEAMLDDLDFDVLAVGDVFAKRGPEVIAALRSGKHVLADKPLCTRLDELHEIRSLAQQKPRTVMVGLGCRYHPTWQETRQLLADGAIGDLATLTVFGHHPLGYKRGRPDWFFQPDMQGGTINDLLIHGIDGIRYMTGMEPVEVTGARAWNAELTEVPFFQDAALAMLRMENGAGVMADCSYKTPRKHAAPWTFFMWGSEGFLKMVTGKPVILQRHDEPERTIEPAPGKRGSFVEDAVAEMTHGPTDEQVLTTAECLMSTEKTLRIQAAADRNETHVEI